MNRTHTTAVIVASIIAPALFAGTFHTIDFGSDFRDPADGIIILDNQFDALFAQHGVHFSSPTSNPIFWLGDDYGFSAAANSIVMGDPRTGETSTHTLRIDFLIPVNFVSMQGIDGGGDRDTLTMRAFNSDNILIGQHSVTHTFGAPQAVSIIAINIDHILILQSGVNHGVFLDNLIYNQIPAPSTFAVLALSLAFKRKR